MNGLPLPPTIAALTRSLVRRDLSVPEALKYQADYLASHVDEFGSIASLHDTNNDIEPRGPLAGVGLAHKDVFDLAGRSPRCGALIAPRELPERSAHAIAKLTGAGASNLAALSMAEFACGATGENEHASDPVNPLDASAAVGGSSSGSAVAVAAGLCYASLGTDTAGSIRIPAATCGLLGLKPTYGAVSTAGVFPLAPSLDCVGIISRSAIDAGMVLAALKAGNDRYVTHHGSIELDLDRRATSPWRVRVSIPSDGIDPDVHAALTTFVESLRRKAHVQEVSIPEVEDLNRCSDTLLCVEAARTHYSRLRHQPDLLGSSVRIVALPGFAIPEAWYAAAHVTRPQALRRFCAAILGDADILLVPALPCGVPDWSLVHTKSPMFDASLLLALIRWMPFVNYLGLPAVVFPVGNDSRQRPVSVQVIARAHMETTLLAFAHSFEREHFGTAGFLAGRH